MAFDFLLDSCTHPANLDVPAASILGFPALQEAVDRAKREAGEAANLPEMHWRGGILNDKGALPALSPTPCCRNPARMV